MQSTFIALESLEIARPCRADWNKMAGDERVRACKTCQKNVYNLSEMTRDDAMRLVTSKENLCVRLHRRSDGTVITSDCPVGELAPKRAPLLRVFVAAIGLLTGMLGLRGAWVQNAGVRVTAGAPMFVPAQPKNHGNASRTTRKNRNAKRGARQIKHRRHRR